MLNNFFKFFTVVFLLAMFLLPQNFYAQELRVIKSDAERVIKQYEQGQLTNPTSQEKQIVSEYLESNQKKAPFYQNRILSPNATSYIDEDFAVQAPLLVDDFDFTGLLTANGWTETSGAGAGAIGTTTGLSYTDYPGSGIGNAALLDSNGQDVNKQFTSQTSGYVYYSFLVNVKTGTQGYFIHLGNSVSTFASRLFVRPSATLGKLNFGMSNSSSGTITYGTTDFDDSTTYLIIVKSQVANPGTNDVWVLSSGVPATEVAAGTPEISTNVGTGLTSITGIYLRQYTATQNITVDGIRVGTSWGELFPTGLPSGWAQNLISGTFPWYFDNPGLRTLNAPITAPAAIFDSDFNGGGTAENVALESSTFSPPAATTVLLEWDQYFRGGFGGAAFVEVWNGSAWVQVYTATASTTDPNHQTINISAHVAGVANAQVRFRWTGDYSWYWIVDNVKVYEPDAFPLPALLVNPLDAEIDVFPSTTLDWVAGGGSAPTGYRLYFGTDGGGVSLPTSIANNVDLGLVTQYTPASPLNIGTTYYWSIVPYNGAGSATGNPIWSFTTLTPFAQPYSEDFNDTTAAGWFTTGFGLFANHGTSGSVAASKNFYSSATTGWIQTPPVGPLTATSQLEFSYRIVNWSGYPGTATVLGADSFKIQISTDFGTTFTNAYAITASNHVTSTNYITVVVPLGSYSGQNVIVRWDGKWAAGDYYFDIDDVKIRETPAVADPTAFIAAPFNSSQINLSFTPDGSNHNVVVVWNSTGTFTAPVGAPVVGGSLAGGTVLSIGTTSPVNHTGLTFATTYYYKAFSYDGSTYSTPGAISNATTSIVNPTAVTANPVSGSQIDLGWVKNLNNDNVMVVTNSVNTFGVPVNGTAYAVNDPVTGGGTVVFNGSANTFNHSALTAGTTYYYKVYSAEAVTNYYSTGVTANATTPFGIPYLQDFNAGTTLPIGWAGSFYVSATHGVGGNGLTKNIYTVGTSGFTRTPFVGPAASNTTLQFDYRIVDFTSYPTTPTVYGAGNYIDVQVSTDNTNWTTIYTINNVTHVTSLAFATKVFNLNAFSGSLVYVRFNGVWASGDYYVDFDNVYIGSPLVANPASFTATSISTSQIDLAFTPNAGTNNVLIVWNNTGTFTIPSGTPPALGQPFAGGTLLSNGISSPVNHTGLNASTTYYYKAFSYDGTDYSTGLNANATTVCGVASLPFAESFDGTLFPPTCWTRINAGTGNNWQRATTGQYAGAGTMAYGYNGTNPANSWMISPEITLESGKKYYVSFYQNTAGGATYPEKMKVTVGTAPDVISQTTTIWDNNGGTELTNVTYELRVAEFVAPSTGSYYFGFNVYSDADMYNLFVDEISIIEQPTVDLAFTQFSQTSGLPVPKAGQNFSDYNVTLNKQTLIDGKKQTMELTNQSNAVSSSNVNNTVIVPENGSLNLDALGNIGVSAEIANLGVNAASYNLNWSVNSIAQTPYSGPTVNSGSNHVANLTFASIDRGTFITTGAITVAGDEIASNNANQFRMRVYPDVFTRTIYDRGDNLVDTYIGWGPTGTTPFKAGVRFTAASEIKLAGVDFIYRTEDLVPGQITVQVRAAGTTTTAPGTVLYTAVFNSAAYFSSTGDYIHLPFGNDAPIIASGSDYWITVKVPLGADYPGAAQTGAGITLGRSFYESNTDTTLWNALILTPDEFAWIMRSVEVTAGPATFAFSTSVNNGWNMVSAPGLHPTNQDVTTWWPGKDPAAGVFRFSGGYLPVTTTTPGQGYWMKHAGPFTYNYTGIQVVANDPIAGVTGWNLIGGYELNVLTSGITTSPAGLQTGSVFQYGTGYTVATNLVPGYGYWIKLTGAGSINIPTTLAKGLAKTEVNTSDWGKIIITDKTGKSYTLYTVKGEVNLNDYELPPAPPEGMFDVRFGSGRYAEELSAVNQSIELNSLEYPVRVRVENADIRLQDGTGNGLNERLKSGEEVTISNSAINKLMVSGDVIPATYSLDQNYPNPFNPSTKIEFSIPEDVNNVTLTIYNALGQRVAELVNSKMEAGKYSYVWNASDVATGLYIYELRTDKFVSVKKMMLLK